MIQSRFAPTFTIQVFYCCMQTRTQRTRVRSVSTNVWARLKDHGLCRLLVVKRINQLALPARRRRSCPLPTDHLRQRRRHHVWRVRQTAVTEAVRQDLVKRLAIIIIIIIIIIVTASRTMPTLHCHVMFNGTEHWQTSIQYARSLIRAYISGLKLSRQVHFHPFLLWSPSGFCFVCINCSFLAPGFSPLPHCLLSYNLLNVQL